MFTKITVIGICVGAVILGLGAFAFINSPPWPHTKTIDETIHIGNIATYEFTAQQRSHQNFKVIGESFHVKLTTPGEGIQSDDDFKKQIMFDWYVLQEGTNKILVNNTGSSELAFEATFEQFGDNLYILHNVLLITTGIVIIGFSGAFSVRKPKGF